MVIAAAEQSGELASGRVAWRGAIAAKHALDRQYDTGLGSRVASEIRFMQFVSVVSTEILVNAGGAKPAQISQH